MSSYPDTSLSRFPYRFLSFGKSMSPVDRSQNFIICRFDSILYTNITTPGQSGNIIQYVIGHSIRTGSDHQSYYIGTIQCLLILLP